MLNRFVPLSEVEGGVLLVYIYVYYVSHFAEQGYSVPGEQFNRHDRTDLASDDG